MRSCALRQPIAQTILPHSPTMPPNMCLPSILMVRVCDAFKTLVLEFCSRCFQRKYNFNSWRPFSAASIHTSQTLIGGWGRWKLLPRELISIARGQGRELSMTRFAKPGSSTTSPRNPTPRSRYEWQFGTSMSTPYVSGAAALVVSEFGYSGSHIRCAETNHYLDSGSKHPFEQIIGTANSEFQVSTVH